MGTLIAQSGTNSGFTGKWLQDWSIFKYSLGITTFLEGMRTLLLVNSKHFSDLSWERGGGGGGGVGWGGGSGGGWRVHPSVMTSVASGV